MTINATHASPLAPEWLAVPEDLNALQAPMWAAGGVEKNDAGEVTIDGVSVSKLKEQYGTPLFVMSESDFRSVHGRSKTRLIPPSPIFAGEWTSTTPESRSCALQ